MLDADECLGPEIKYRQLQTSQSSTPLRRSLFKNVGIDRKDLAQVADAPALSRLTYNAKGWPTLTVLYRSAAYANANQQAECRITDNQVLKHIGGLDLQFSFKRTTEWHTSYA